MPDEENVKQQYAQGKENGKTVEPAVPEDLLQAARRFTDTAGITICRFSGEGWDRKGIPGDGDFYLSPQEQAMVDAVTSAFPRVAVVLDVGGMVDSAWFKDNDRIQSVLLAWQAGIEGGLAVADILCGDVNPSGKLPYVVPVSEEDLPHVDWEATDQYYEYYHGYTRLEKNGVKPLVPYGFGLSYTTFEITAPEAKVEGDNLVVTANVKNTGKMDGDEVVQLYVGFENSAVDRPVKQLRGFQRISLKAGEEKKVTVSTPLEKLKWYNPVYREWQLEHVEHSVYVGSSSASEDLVKTSIVL